MRTTAHINYDTTHRYAAKSKATVVKAGSVFYSEPVRGWTFNVIIDDICVKSRFLFPSHRVAEEAMRLEVDSICATITGTSKEQDDGRSDNQNEPHPS